MKAKMHTLNSIRSKCVVDGDCWLWATKTKHEPQVRHGGRTRYARNLVRELTDGKPVPRGRGVSSKCETRNCVSPTCGVITTHATRNKLMGAQGKRSSSQKGMRIAMARRAQSRYSDEVVEYVRNAAPPCRLIAEATGMSLSYIRAIRQGVLRKDYSNPFVALMTSNNQR